MDLLRICCGPVDSCGPMFIYNVSLRIYSGSAAGPLILAAPLFIYSVSLRICCGSAAGLLILAGPLFAGVSLRIYCGPVDSCGPHCLYIVFLCGSTADLLRAR